MIVRKTIPALALCAVAAIALPARPAAASGYTLKTLYTFCVQSGCPDGNYPFAGVVADKNGTLYGSAPAGGKFGGGVVFSMAPKNKTYKFHTLYSFCKQSDCPDGSSPEGLIVLDANGNLYGTTMSGGTEHYGVIFRLSPGRKGWKYKVIYTFCTETQCTDGAVDEGGLSYKGQAAGKVWDGKSPLFGSVAIGGKYDNGAIFSLTPNGSNWDYAVIHNIQTGQAPNPVLVDQGGNLFITSQQGGANSGGNFYTLANGTWKESTIHNFCSDADCADGKSPMGTLALDGDGNVFGVTTQGGSGGNGVLFEHPAAGGFAVVYNFCSDGSCGVYNEDLSFGNVTHTLLGVAQKGGSNNDGVVYAFAFKNGIWNQKVIEDFCADGNCTSGAYPGAPVLEDASGNLFGTTIYGGNLACGGGGGCGTVFELKKK